MAGRDRLTHLSWGQPGLVPNRTLFHLTTECDRPAESKCTQPQKVRNDALDRPMLRPATFAGVLICALLSSMWGGYASRRQHRVVAVHAPRLRASAALVPASACHGIGTGLQGVGRSVDQGPIGWRVARILNPWSGRACEMPPFRGIASPRDGVSSQSRRTGENLGGVLRRYPHVHQPVNHADLTSIRWCIRASVSSGFGSTGFIVRPEP